MITRATPFYFRGRTGSACEARDALLAAVPLHFTPEDRRRHADYIVDSPDYTGYEGYSLAVVVRYRGWAEVHNAELSAAFDGRTGYWTVH